MALMLQPLRVPSGWEIKWNLFYDLPPSRETIEARMFADSQLLFWAVHPKRRFGLSMEWRWEPKPLGQFALDVLYAPRLLTPQGRQDKSSPLDFAPKPVYQFEASSHTVMAKPNFI